MASKGNQSPSKSQSQPKTPSGHFNANGTSQGKQNGSVRPQADACNEKKGSK